MEEIKLPAKVQFIEAEKKANKATLIVEPLYPGYGMTLGNALRRILLSSIAGAAITAVKIDGVDHEFTSLDGIKEDAVEIIINLKKIRLKMHSAGPVTLKLKKKGEGAVTAGDIDASSDIEIINPDQLIATSTDKSRELAMDIIVEQGRGYLPVEAREKEKADIGELPVDAIFTPIKLVNFRIDNVRVGKQTNFDQLSMDIETDGTLTPREAFDQAGKILVDHFNIFLSTETLKEAELRKAEEERKRQAFAEKKKSDEKEEEAGVLATPVEDLGLSRRTTNALYNNDIKTVKDIVKLNSEEISEMRGLGGKAITEIKQVLKKMDLALSAEED